MAMRLVSSDLNGTLVREQTMSDMVRLYRNQAEYGFLTSLFVQKVEGDSNPKSSTSL